jgi:hypothetical protein
MKRRLLIYTDASVIGGCEDSEFQEDSRLLWETFIKGSNILVLSEHTFRELISAPEEVRAWVTNVPPEHTLVLTDSDEAFELAEAYLQHRIVGPSSRSDALHIALATIGRVDVVVSWNFRHIVNLGRIRLFNAVNLENGYIPIEIRTPKEIISYEEEGL